jgi:2,3-bisphosphoglycerate-independent phosphoglycerate mutase
VPPECTNLVWTDLVLRCNTVTVDAERQTLSDFTADLISDNHARRLISQINLPYSNWELYPGQSYRNILIIREANIDVRKIKCFEPHMNIGNSVHEVLPRGSDEATRYLTEQISAFLLDTQRQISSMEVARHCAANMLWVWSPSKKPVWPSFKERTGLSAAVVGGLDFLHGLAMAAELHFDVIPGATGYIDTNYRAKADYTIKYLHDFDFVLTHVNAADEEAHQRNHFGKITAIEMTDRHIVGPLLFELQKYYPNNFRIAVCGDHTTRCCDGKHTADPVPFALYGRGINASNTPGFSERICSEQGLTNSTTFLREILWQL